MSNEITWRAATREEQDLMLDGASIERGKGGDILRVVVEQQPNLFRLTAHEGTIRVQVPIGAFAPPPRSDFAAEPTPIPPQNYVAPVDELKPSEKTPTIEHVSMALDPHAAKVDPEDLPAVPPEHKQADHRHASKRK